ncbi:hypothetical protein VNO80_16032 [Phaseolus coccineus]|uniref:Uncharacterized protein n=1 Tax=Phaseolus coccineus TaxID=3886 RepID=A0AAN9MMR5_PHACN
MSSSSLLLSSHSISEGISLVDREINPINANSSSESFSTECDFHNAQPISVVKSTIVAASPSNGILSSIPLAHVKKGKHQASFKNADENPNTTIAKGSRKGKFPPSLIPSTFGYSRKFIITLPSLTPNLKSVSS